MLDSKQIWNIITGSSIDEIRPVDDTQDMLGICKEVTDDRNVFRFSSTSKRLSALDGLLAMIADKPVSLFDAIKSFRYWYHINRGALGGTLRESYVNLGTSMIGYQSGIEYRKAGLIDPLMNPEKKHSILDKLRKK